MATLNRVADDDFSWNVPGLREELVAGLIRSLPKQLRVSFVPAPNTAREFLAAVPPGEEPLLDALERYLRGTRGVAVPREAWDWSKVAEHLRPTYRVLDEAGGEQARGKDLEALKEPLRPQFAAAVAEVAAETTATGQTTLDVRDDPGRADLAPGRARGARATPRWTTRARPSGSSCAGRRRRPTARHRLGVARLLLLALPRPDVLAGLDNAAKLGLAGSPYPSVADLSRTAAGRSCSAEVDARPPVRDEQAYDELAGAACAPTSSRGCARVLTDVTGLLDRWRRVDRTLSGRAELATLPSLTDMRDQLARLVHPGFVGEAGLDRLRRYPTYLTALEQRRERLDEQPARDREPLARIVDLQSAYLHQVDALPAGRPPSAALRTVRWLLEEYRVSLWAQQLGHEKVSDQRVRAALSAAASTAT